MTRKLLFTFLLLITVFIGFAQPKAEVRAVWLTTNGGSDWPKGNYTESVQKQNLSIILDKLSEANFNTIILQVQVKGDALWSSTIQPAMYDFTGNGSKNLSWNVCDYVIEECHKRGMECHAWIVPYRIGTTNEANRYTNNANKHVLKTNPELCVLYNGAWYLDPALPEVRKYLIDAYRELISNHDFDGTSFDYTRYPGSDFDDAASYAKYGNGQNKDDWRRENINIFVHEFYDMVKGIKPHIKVGAAPIGTYKNVPGYGNMTAYGSVYQDACEWMQAGKQDLLIPQMYWNEKYGFSPNMTTWVANSAGRQLVVGLAPYKMDDANAWDYTVVTDQVEKIRAKDGMSGVCFFRTDHVIGNTTKVKQLYAALKDDYFKYPANIVPMTYNGVTKPNAPINPTKEYSNGEYTFNWESPTVADGTPIKYYCVYASTTSTVDVSDIRNCIGFYITANSFTYPSSNASMNFAITAFDNNYYESDAAIFKTSGIDDVSNDDTQFIYHNQELTIESDVEIATVTVFNSMGAVVKQQLVKDRSTTVSFVNESRGAYIVLVENANATNSVHKIIR